MSEPLDRFGLLTLDGFGSWLRAQPAEMVVGWVGRCSSCPLATYARREMGVRGAMVGVSQFVVGTRVWKLPDWAQVFVERVDAWPRAEGDGAVTAGTALEVLRDLEGRRWAA